MAVELDEGLKQGAEARLRAVRARLHQIEAEIERHERSLHELRTQLPDLHFEEAAMRYIVEGALPPAGAAPLATGRKKLERSEIVDLIKARMRSEGRSLEVGEIHRYLEGEAAVDLGSNARNYLCGILSRNKGVHFVNVGKGEWWLSDDSP